MDDATLCKFLREHSSGFYRPCAEAAERIEQLKKQLQAFKDAAVYMSAVCDLDDKNFQLAFEKMKDALNT